jgi:phospholipid/cholesterol/gamma-HCH transport system substrate-binding protein
LRIPREVKVGFFFILAIAGLIWGFNFLKGKNIFKTSTLIYAVYPDVNGLEPSNPVYINGLKVGQVSNIAFLPEMSGEIIVEMTLSTDFPIPNNTVARIFSSDLMGSRAIDLIVGDSEELIVSGDTLITSIEASLKEEVNKQILPLKRKAEDLILSIDSMVVAIQGVFNKDIRDELLASIQSIRATFRNLESTTGNIDTLVVEQSGRLASILRNIDMITYNLRENEEQINAVFANLETITDSLSQSHIPETFNNLNKVVSDIEVITDKIQRGEGTFGQLLYNDTLYFELERTARELNMLLEDIRVNPKRYVKFSIF